MPILRCEFGGCVVDIPVTDATIARVRNAMLLPDIQIDVWDAMTKARKAKMVRDYEWFSALVTKHKIAGTALAVGMHKQTLGQMRGNLG